MCAEPPRPITPERRGRTGPPDAFGVRWTFQAHKAWITPAGGIFKMGDLATAIAKPPLPFAKVRSAMTKPPLCYPGEVWKAVPYPLLAEPLEASDLGRIRRPTRSYWVSRNDIMPFVATRRSRIANAIPRVGYPSVPCKLQNGTRPYIGVHILVCYAFHGQPPSAEHEVGHWDGNPLNPLPGNVRWVTPLENAADRERHGRTVKGEKMWTSVLTDEAIAEIRAECLHYVRGDYTRLAARYGVNRTTIQRAANIKTWRHISE